MPQKIVFRIGEFARLVGVNKKTLQYYDGRGVFKPDSVAENGYRSYSSRQLYSFHMIRMLREMGLSLEEIREYLQNRTPEQLDRLLREQRIWLKQEIRRYERMNRIVSNQLRLLDLARDLDCERVVVQELEETRLLITQNVYGLDEAEEERILQEHENYCLSHELNEGWVFGAMVPPENFMQAGAEIQPRFYFTRIQKDLRYVEKKRRHLRPAGPYVVTYMKGDYMDTSPAYQRLRSYMQAHGLRAAGYAYEESVLEDMSTPNPAEYVTRIVIPVLRPAVQEDVVSGGADS